MKNIYMLLIAVLSIIGCDGGDGIVSRTQLPNSKVTGTLVLDQTPNLKPSDINVTFANVSSTPTSDGYYDISCYVDVTPNDSILDTLRVYIKGELYLTRAIKVSPIASGLELESNYTQWSRVPSYYIVGRYVSIDIPTQFNSSEIRVGYVGSDSVDRYTVFSRSSLLNAYIGNVYVLSSYGERYKQTPLLKLKVSIRDSLRNTNLTTNQIDVVKNDAFQLSYTMKTKDSASWTLE